jgi:hypothetical protein
MAQGSPHCCARVYADDREWAPRDAALALKADHFRTRSDSAVPDRAKHSPPFHRQPTQGRSSREVRKGHRSGSNCRLSVRSSQLSGRPASRRAFLLSIIDRLVSCGTACAIDFCFPNDAGMMRLLSRVALHQKVAFGVPSVEVSHDQCQRSHAATRLRSESRCSALARKSRLATKSSRR